MQFIYNTLYDQVTVCNLHLSVFLIYVGVFLSVVLMTLTSSVDSYWPVDIDF